MDCRRVRCRLEDGLAGRAVRGEWICPEIMVEGDVLLKDNDDVFNRRRSRWFARQARQSVAGRHSGRHCKRHDSGDLPNVVMSHGPLSFGMGSNVTLKHQPAYEPPL